jgi:hypothetical protein
VENCENEDNYYEIESTCVDLPLRISPARLEFGPVGDGLSIPVKHFADRAAWQAHLDCLGIPAPS